MKTFTGRRGCERRNVPPSFPAESGRRQRCTSAPCDVVQKMCELYEDPDLKAQHIRAVCPLLADYGGSGYGELALAALNWAVQLADVQTVTLQFAAIASDGRINPHEREAARAIRARAVTLRQVMEDTIEAIDKAMNRRNGQ